MKYINLVSTALLLTLLVGCGSGDSTKKIDNNTTENNITATQKLLHSGAGISVAIDDDTLVVKSFKTLSLLVYERDDATGVFVKKARLAASDTNQSVGVKNIAISGGTIIFSGYSRLATSNMPIYLFMKPDSGWQDATEDVKLMVDSNNSSCCYRLSIDGDTIVAGEHDDRSSSAFVFVKPNGGWVNMTQDARLTASVRSEYDRFGSSVSISGDTIVVGAASSGASFGRAFVFVRPSDGWKDTEEDAILTASSVDATHRDSFGSSVSISGDTIVVGTDSSSDKNSSIFVFAKPNDGWKDATPDANLTTSDTNVGKNFGHSVSIDSNTIAVSSYHRYSPDIDAGIGYSDSAYIFRKPLNGWVDRVEDIKLTLLNPVLHSAFGASISVSNDTIVVADFNTSYIVEVSDYNTSNLIELER